MSHAQSSSLTPPHGHHYPSPRCAILSVWIWTQTRPPKSFRGSPPINHTWHLKENPSLIQWVALSHFYLVPVEAFMCHVHSTARGQVYRFQSQIGLCSNIRGRFWGEDFRACSLLGSKPWKHQWESREARRGRKGSKRLKITISIERIATVCTWSSLPWGPGSSCRTECSPGVPLC